MYILCTTIRLYTLHFWVYKCCTKYLFVPNFCSISFVQSMYTQIIVYHLARTLYTTTLYKLRLVVVRKITLENNARYNLVAGMKRVFWGIPENVAFSENLRTWKYFHMWQGESHRFAYLILFTEHSSKIFYLIFDRRICLCKKKCVFVIATIFHGRKYHLNACMFREGTTYFWCQTYFRK